MYDIYEEFSYVEDDSAWYSDRLFTPEDHDIAAGEVAAVKLAKTLDPAEEVE